MNTKHCLFLLLISSALKECVCCRHSMVPSNVSFTSFEVLLLLYTALVFGAISVLLPRCLWTYKEIHEMIAERKVRYTEIRKLQKSKKIQTHVPLHFLRSYYGNDCCSSKSTKSSASDTEQRHVVSTLTN